MKKRIIRPEVKTAAKHATRAMRPHMIFLLYRVLIFGPTVLAILPSDHAIFLVDAVIIETSGLILVWVRKVRHHLRSRLDI